MSPKDNAKFQAIVARNASVGMPLDVALRNLTSAGFSCSNQHVASGFDCVRQREGFLYSCMQRVTLAETASRHEIQSVDPRPIMCAGL
jgi:hypothetical protein